jgi:hypothetical protein
MKVLDLLDYKGSKNESRISTRQESLMEWNLVWTTVAAVAAALSAITGAASAYAAFRAIKENNSNHTKAKEVAENERKNERLLAHAITTLERSYRTLDGGKSSLSVPPKSRINWLTSARLIQEYKSTKSRIQDPLILQECISHEAYWRNQFYVRIDPLGHGFPDYFKQENGESIQLTSAMVVADFATWPEGTEDPLAELEASPEAISGRPLHLKWFYLSRAVERNKNAQQKTRQ